MRRIFERRSILVSGQIYACMALFAVPINKPATNIFIVLAFLCSLLAPQALQRYRWGLSQATVRGTLLWLAVLLANYLFFTWQVLPEKGIGSGILALAYPLLYAALFAGSKPWRYYAMYSFGAAVGLVLLVSWLRFFGVLEGRSIGGAMEYTVFKEYTQQGLEILALASMAFAVGLTSLYQRCRWACCILVALAVCNVVFVTPSRTSLLTLAPLLLLWGVFFLYRSHFSIKKYFVLGLIVCSVFGMAFFSSNVSDRLVQSVQQEVTTYQEQHQATSTGIRLEMWGKTMEMIAERPWFGHGLETWNTIFNQRFGGAKSYAAFLNHGHPHQEMLLVIFETGFVGFTIWALLLLGLLRYCLRLPLVFRSFYVSLFLIYMVAGLGNGLWSDFTHRHMFVLLLACIPLCTQSRFGSHPQAKEKAK